VFADECGKVPTSGCYINQDTTFISGTYSVNFGVIINKSNIVLDCNNSWLYGPNLNFGIRVFDKTRVIIKNCKLTNYEYGIYLRNSSFNNIINNTFENNVVYGIFLRNSDNNKVINNSLLGNIGGVYLRAHNNILYNNLLSDNSISGFEVDVSDNNEIFSNKIINNNNAYGVWLKNSKWNLFSNNSITRHRYGVFLQSSDNNKINNNEVQNNSEINMRGVYIQASNDNDIRGNTVTRNFHGIVLDGASVTNIIEYNNLYDNDGDIYSYDLYNNQADNISARYNWWGTINSNEIDINIYDDDEDITKGRVDYGNWLTQFYNLTNNKYVITLNTGWNLVSIPLDSNVESLPSLLNSIKDKYDKVLTYNHNKGWVSYRPDKPDFLNGLQRINETIGFWVHMLEPAALEIQGFEAESSILELSKGWNLIGYPSVYEANVSHVFEEVLDELHSIFMYDSEWKDYGAGTDLLTTVKPGFGYWVKVNKNTRWIFENGKYKKYTGQATFQKDLLPGWNLISLPLQPDNITTENILTSLTGQIVVWYYNASTDAWTVYDSDAPFPWLNTLHTLEYGKAYWLSTTTNQTLTVQGDIMPDYTIRLINGWNFVGYRMSTDSMPDPISSLTRPITVWTYYTGGDRWEVYDTEAPFPWLNTLTEMRAGKGCWMKSSVAQDWTI